MRFGLLCLFLSGLALGKTEPAPVRVRLEEAKRYAIENNFEVSALRQQAKELEALQGKSRSGFFPTLGIAAGAENTQGQNAALGFAYANFNVFRGFADTYQSQIAAIDAEMGTIRLRQTEFRTGLAVEEKFNLYLLKKILIDLKQEAIKLNTTHKGMASRRMGSGLAAGSDVMEFELRDSLLRSDLVLLSQELEEVRIELKQLLGEQIGGNIEPVGGLAHQHIKANLMEYLSSLHESNESIRLANRELAKANVESKLWRASWLPKFDLQAKVGYVPIGDRPPADDGKYTSNGPTAMGQALLTWDIFTGFSSHYERKEGEAKALRAEAMLKKAIQSTVTETEMEFRRLRSIQERVDIEDKNEDRAKKYYDAVMSEYRRGVKNSADVKVAAELLFETRSRRETYKYDFLKERVDLERAIGKPVTVEVHED